MNFARQPGALSSATSLSPCRACPPSVPCNSRRSFAFSDGIALRQNRSAGKGAAHEHDQASEGRGSYSLRSFKSPEAGKPDGSLLPQQHSSPFLGQKVQPGLPGPTSWHMAFGNPEARWLSLRLQFNGTILARTSEPHSVILLFLFGPWAGRWELCASWASWLTTNSLRAFCIRRSSPGMSPILWRSLHRHLPFDEQAGSEKRFGRRGPAFTLLSARCPQVLWVWPSLMRFA